MNVSSFLHKFSYFVFLVHNYSLPLSLSSDTFLLVYEERMVPVICLERVLRTVFYIGNIKTSWHLSNWNMVFRVIWCHAFGSCFLIFGSRINYIVYLWSWELCFVLEALSSIPELGSWNNKLSSRGSIAICVSVIYHVTHPYACQGKWKALKSTNINAPNSSVTTHGPRALDRCFKESSSW